jgi:hypothetical protein
LKDVGHREQVISNRRRLKQARLPLLHVTLRALGSPLVKTLDAFSVGKERAGRLFDPLSFLNPPLTSEIERRVEFRAPMLPEPEVARALQVFEVGGFAEHGHPGSE